MVLETEIPPGSGLMWGASPDMWSAMLSACPFRHQCAFFAAAAGVGGGGAPLRWFRG